MIRPFRVNRWTLANPNPPEEDEPPIAVPPDVPVPPTDTVQTAG